MPSVTMSDILSILLLLWMFDNIPVATSIAIRSLKAVTAAAKPLARSVPVYYDVAALPFLGPYLWPHKHWIAAVWLASGLTLAVLSLWGMVKGKKGSNPPGKRSNLHTYWGTPRATANPPVHNQCDEETAAEGTTSNTWLACRRSFLLCSVIDSLLLMSAGNCCICMLYSKAPAYWLKRPG